MTEVDRALILARKIKAEMLRGNRRKVCVFLGAGASVSSGGPDFITLKRSTLENIVSEKVKLKDINDLEDLFETVFNDVKPYERVSLLCEHLNPEGRPISDGYIYLSLLTKLGIIDFVLTTNFDNFLESAATLVFGEDDIFDPLTPNRIGPDYDFEKLLSRKVPLVKLHGDCENGIYNISSKELNDGRYPENVARIIQKVFKTHEVVFIGYGGHERKLARTLMDCVNELTDIYWLNPQPVEAAEKLHLVISEYLRLTNIPTATSSLYFDNALETIAMETLGAIENFHEAANARFVTFEIIKRQIAFWNSLTLGPNLPNKKRAIEIKRIYAERDDSHNFFHEFLSSQQYVAILNGRSGFGKTTFLKKFALDIDDEQTACLFLPAKHLSEREENFEVSLARYVGIRQLGKTEINLLGKELVSKNKRVIIIVDGINEFSPDYQSCRSLYRQIFAFACELQQCGLVDFKIILSCRNETWERISDEEIQKAGVFFNDGKPTIIEQFSHKEFTVAYKQYKKAYKIKTDYSELAPLTKERLRDPFMLGLMCEIQEGANIIATAPSYRIYTEYFNSKLAKNQNIDQRIFLQYLVDFAKTCLERSTEKLTDYDLPRSSYNNIIQILLDLNILSKYSDVGETFYGWGHDRYFEYFLSRAIRSRKIQGEQDLLDIFSDSQEFSYLYGAVKLAIHQNENASLLLNCLDSDSIPIRSFIKDLLFEISQISPDFFARVLEQYLEGDQSNTGLRILLQAASLNAIHKPLILRILRSSEDNQIQSEANYYYISHCISDIQRRKRVITASALSTILDVSSYKSGWFRLSLLLSLASRLSWDNFSGNVDKYFEALLTLLKESIDEISEDNTQDVVNNIDNYTNKYFFNASDVSSFFNRSDEQKKELQECINMIITHSREIENEFSRIFSQIDFQDSINLMILKIILIFLGQSNSDAIKKLLLDKVQEVESAQMGDFCSAQAAYLYATRSVDDIDFVHKINEFFFEERPEMLAEERSYEELFNPVGTYGFIFPIRRPNQKIDLYTFQIKKLVSQGNNTMLLRILHALRQSVSIFPDAGLRTLQDLLDYKDNVQVRQRTLNILGESFARNPQVTDAFLYERQSSFTTAERYRIKFTLDPKIYAHPITILEWGRIYSLFFSIDNYREHLHKTLTLLNFADSLQEFTVQLLAMLKR